MSSYQTNQRTGHQGVSGVSSEHARAIEAIESLLKDIEQALAQQGELSYEQKAAIERLRNICRREKASPVREKDEAG